MSAYLSLKSEEVSGESLRNAFVRGEWRIGPLPFMCGESTAAKPRKYNTNMRLCRTARRKGMSGCSLTYGRCSKLIVGHAPAFPRNQRGTILSPSIYRDAKPQQHCQQGDQPYPKCMEDSPKAVVKPLSLGFLTMLLCWRVGCANSAFAASVAGTGTVVWASRTMW